jgi:hypothetical protein
MPGLPSGTDGYFTNSYFSGLKLLHGFDQGAGRWIQLGQDNSWLDASGDGDAPNLPWSSGDVFWNIFAYWHVGPDTNQPSIFLTNWQQTISIDSLGTMSVMKFGHTATRDTNNQYR